MTLEQAIEIITDHSLSDLVITIQFNTDDEWIDGIITPYGDPFNDLASVSGDGTLTDAIVSLAEALEIDNEI